MEVKSSYFLKSRGRGAAPYRVRRPCTPAVRTTRYGTSQRLLCDFFRDPSCDFEDLGFADARNTIHELTRTFTKEREAIVFVRSRVRGRARSCDRGRLLFELRKQLASFPGVDQVRLEQMQRFDEGQLQSPPAFDDLSAPGPRRPVMLRRY